MTHYSTLREQGRLARFVPAKAEPEKSTGLAISHAAVAEGRTLFPTRVTSVADSKRLLISGVNNSKIGKRVEKGAWKGFPVFTLTLEERATCPRSCGEYQTCFGNGMHFPERRDHRDPDFIPALRAEAIALCRQYPDGVAIRLHVLGDFFSVEYVRMWASLIDTFPQLHIYGYTARRLDKDDKESRAIAAAIMTVVYNRYDQFAVRFSHDTPAWNRAIVVDAPIVGNPQVIMCPAQTEKTETCGTCALCWSPSAQDKTIAFLRHGMKRLSGRRKPREDGFTKLDIGHKRRDIVRKLPRTIPPQIKDPVAKIEGFFEGADDGLVTSRFIHELIHEPHICKWPFGGGCEASSTSYRKPYCEAHTNAATLAGARRIQELRAAKENAKKSA